jgi:hypothetical protein
MTPEAEAAVGKAIEADIPTDDIQQAPLLAHYTSLEAVEKILTTDQLWFSNPLLMNDHEEVGWGIRTASSVLQTDVALLDALSTDKENLFISYFLWEIENYGKVHLFDTYVFCLSEFDGSNDDGRLSMWRGYGGYGAGAAIVFNPQRINATPYSPLIFGKVQYGSSAERFGWISGLVNRLTELFRIYTFTPEETRNLASRTFERIKLAALFSKHEGFAEEREWRVVYMRERDHNNAFVGFFDYIIGPNGMEPKLKFPVQPIEAVTSADLSLEKLIDRIVLGPSRASGLAEDTAKRMLSRAGKAALVPRLKASQIPLRAGPR